MKEKNSTGCSDNLVEMNHITKVFHGQRALDQVSLNCVYGLLGPNGAGKSTLLKCLTGMLRPTEGEILFDGHPWTREDLDHIGALVEMPPIYENLSAWENLKVRTLLLGLPDSRIEEVLDIVRLTNTGKKRAGAFSMGMKQRLGIANAILHDPELLILDEPTNGLDPSGIHEIRNLVKSLPSLYDCTVLISSHMLSEIELIADDIGILNHGRLLFEGSMNDLRQYALQSGFAADNLEDVFLSMVEKDNMDRKQRAKL